jgi:hypothetical protein
MTPFGVGHWLPAAAGTRLCSWRLAGILTSYPGNARLGENEKPAQQEIAG